jgi:hypothetical protein
MGAVLMGFKFLYEKKPTHDETILMKLPAEVKARRVIGWLKEPTAGRQPAKGCPAGVKRSESNTTQDPRADEQL